MAIDLKRVKEIFLEAADVSDEAARAAFLERACGGDAGLHELFKDCKNLGNLSLAGTAITDAGLAHLKGSKKLAILNLAGIQVTDAGLAHLAGPNALTMLWIHDSGITDLTPLQGMPLEDIRRTPKNISRLGQFTGM